MQCVHAESKRNVASFPQQYPHAASDMITQSRFKWFAMAPAEKVRVQKRSTCSKCYKNPVREGVKEQVTAANGADHQRSTLQNVTICGLGERGRGEGGGQSASTVFAPSPVSSELSRPALWYIYRK